MRLNCQCVVFLVAAGVFLFWKRLCRLILSFILKWLNTVEYCWATRGPSPEKCSCCLRLCELSWALTVALQLQKPITKTADRWLFSPLHYKLLQNIN